MNRSPEEAMDAFQRFLFKAEDALSRAKDNINGTSVRELLVNYLQRQLLRANHAIIGMIEILNAEIERQAAEPL